MAGSEIAQEWAARIEGLDQLWSLTKGSADVRIAVLDGPPDLASVSDAIAPSGVVEHGTHVYSIIFGSRDGAVVGIAPACSGYSVPIFSAEEGGGVCTQERLAQAIHDAVDAGANIINISAAQQGGPLAISSELREALQAAFAADALVVAATGNHGSSSDALPAAVPGVLAVGAHDDAGIPLAVSNWGPNQRAQGLIATGADVPGACVGGGVCRASGSSFATAAVSGVAGLLMSLDAERGVAPSGARTRQALLKSCEMPEAGEVELAGPFLSGRLNAARAAHLLLSTEPHEGLGEDVIMSEVLEAEAPAPLALASEGEAAALAPAGCGCSEGGGDCGCGGKSAPQLAYAIGRLGISFASQARRDSIWRQVNGKSEGDLKPISDKALRDLFKKQPFQAQSVVWTLSRTEVPMYAISPAGAFAAETYKWLVEEWTDDNVEFVSVPGVIVGKVALYDGSVVDVLSPDLRGMFSWETQKYVSAITEGRRLTAADGVTAAQVDREIGRFLGKIYYSIRNRGVTPEERALNAAATNAFNFSPVIVEAGQEGLTLRDVSVERSPLNRVGSQYYDVLLTFFNPKDRQGTAPLRARFTIDVSDTVPVMIGEPVIWYEY